MEESNLRLKVMKFFNTPKGKKRVENAVASVVRQEVLNLENSVVQAQHQLPFEFGIDNSPIEISEVGDKVSTLCEINFNHEDAERDSFSPGPRKADLIELFSEGWNYTNEKNPPYGKWHGRSYVKAWSQREGTHFVREAVDEYLRSAPTGVSVDIDDRYS